MSIPQFGDFETFVLDEGDRIYRYQVYRRMFTPYEQEQSFMDESVFEDSSHPCKICETITLPDGDILLGLSDVFEDDDGGYTVDDDITYYKLSEIRLECRKSDNTYSEVDEDEG